MNQYDQFCRHYDAAIGDPLRTAGRLYLIQRDLVPHAQDILELGCGTGAVLKHFSGFRNLYGLDLSEGMLSKAVKSVPQARFFHQNMAEFQIEKKFDFIFCVFDSINHLLTFKEWKQMFSSVKKHLNPGGVFFFDMNTIHKLQDLSSQPASVMQFDQNTLIMEVHDMGRGITDWDIQVFEKEKDGRYRLYEETIQEKAFPLDQVLTDLKKRFKRVKVMDDDGGRPKKSSMRLHFVCQV